MIQFDEKLIAEIKQSLEVRKQTCVTCTMFHIKEELCGAVMQRPPARVIAYGCEMYKEAIPF